MIDLISAGITLLDGKDLNKIGEIVSTISKSSGISPVLPNEKMVPLIALHKERARRQALEKMINEIQDSPNYPDEIKSRFALSLKETLQEYRKKIRNLGMAESSKAG